MTENNNAEKKQDNNEKKQDSIEKKAQRRYDATVISMAVLIIAIFFLLLLIYWEAVSANTTFPYSIYLKGIGICFFGLAIFALVKSLKNDRSLVNSFSVNRVKEDRMIREIMVLKTTGKTLFENNRVNEELIPVFQDAENLAHQFKFEESWGHILNAETMLLNSIQDDDESLMIRAKLLLLESEKVRSEWRQNQIKTLLGKDIDNLAQRITKKDLLRAITIRNDYYLTRSHKMNLHRVNANILTAVMILIVGTILFFAFNWQVATLKMNENENFAKGLVIAALFGALGAGFSYGKTLFSYNPEQSKIPDQLLSMAVTAFRFVIGASAAIVILILFNSGFLSEKFSTTILESPLTYIVFSFVAGFSERWVVHVLDLVTDGKGKQKQ